MDVLAISLGYAKFTRILINGVDILVIIYTPSSGL